MSPLQRLVDLAREPSSDKRRELLREVTDLFLDDPQAHGHDARDHFGAIMGQVAFEMEMQVRKTLAERLADVPGAPRNLILQLANDAVEVARPVLTKSQVLTETDLVAIAKIQGQDHLRALSERPDMSEAVTDAIVARGDDSVLESLVKNQTARISRAAMETIVDRSEENAALQTPLAHRPDLPPDLLNEMFLFVSSSVRSYITERMASIDPKILDAALSDSRRRIKRAMTQTPPAFRTAEKVVQQLVQSRQLNEQTLVKMLRNRQMAEFVFGFAHLAEIDLKTAQRALSDKTSEILALVCRAMRFDRATFSTFVLLIDPQRQRSVQETNELMSLYEKVPVDAAQRAMRFWKVRKQTAADAMRASA